MPLPEHIQRAEELIHRLDRLIEELEVPANDRAKIAASCLDVALEHHKAIVWTTSASLHGSAFALVRLEFEAYVRGVWLYNCASDEQVEQFINDKLDKKFGELIAELETQPAFADKALSSIKDQSWKAMNSFTHTGLLQVVRRSTSTHIGANYPEEEILGTLDWAGAVALLAALAIVNMSTGSDAEREERADWLLDQMRELAT